MSRKNLCRRICLALVIAGFFSSGCSRGTQKASENVVVKVNEFEMTSKDFANLLAKKLSTYDALTAKNPTTINRAKSDIVEEFIIQSITLRWAREQGIFVKKEELDEQINSVRTIYPDDLAFRRSLVEEGVSFKDWKTKVEYSLLEKKVVEALSQSLSQPTDEELESYYKRHKDDFLRPPQVKIRQIVVSSDINAKRIVDAMKKGRGMPDLAKEFSISPEGKTGGDLGWIEKGTIEYVDQAFTMKVGQQLGPIKTAYGFHILKVEGIRREKLLPLAEVRDTITGLLMEQRQQAAYTAWLEQQIRRTRVFKDEKFLDSLKVETRS